MEEEHVCRQPLNGKGRETRKHVRLFVASAVLGAARGAAGMPSFGTFSVLCTLLLVLAVSECRLESVSIPNLTAILLSPLLPWTLFVLSYSFLSLLPALVPECCGLDHFSRTSAPNLSP